jgi:hypothetical protein
VRLLQLAKFWLVVRQHTEMRCGALDDHASDVLLTCWEASKLACLLACLCWEALSARRSASPGVKHLGHARLITCNLGGKWAARLMTGSAVQKTQK